MIGTNSWIGGSDKTCKAFDTLKSAMTTSASTKIRNVNLDKLNIYATNISNIPNFMVCLY